MRGRNRKLRTPRYAIFAALSTGRAGIRPRPSAPLPKSLPSRPFTSSHRSFPERVFVRLFVGRAAAHLAAQLARPEPALLARAGPVRGQRAAHANTAAAP